MDSALESTIKERGSKPAIYEHFKYHPTLHKYIPPFVTVEPGKALTKNEHTFLRQMLSTANTDEVLVRTSQGWSDWIGNVGTMPSPSCRLEDVDQTIDETRAQCHDPALLEYARLERNGYDPNRVHHLIVPNFQRQYTKAMPGCMTEHPNQEGMLYVDVYDTNEQLHYPVNYMHGAESNDMSSLKSNHPDFYKFLKDTVRMQEAFRESGDFSIFDAHQFEFGLIETNTTILTILYQIRRFAHMCLIPEEEQITYNINTNPDEDLIRVLGVTPIDGLHLPIIQALTIQDAVKKANNDGRQCIVAPMRPRDELGTIIAPQIRAYIPNGYGHCVPAMQHKVTRFAMHCLENNGTVILDMSGGAFMQVGNAHMATVIANGKNFTIIPD